MKRNGNFYYHIRAMEGRVIHRGAGQSLDSKKAKGAEINGVEKSESQNGIIDLKITQEGLREMRRKSLVVIGDQRRIWTPSRIAKFAHRIQVMNIGERVETAKENSGHRNRKGNIKF